MDASQHGRSRDGLSQQESSQQDSSSRQGSSQPGSSQERVSQQQGAAAKVEDLARDLADSSSSADDARWVERFLQNRQTTLSLTAPLEIEDYATQPMADASPPKWHLAHTTWFYETFIVKPWKPAYRPSNPLFEHLFNSYYNGVGTPFPRAKRGTLSRPTLQEVFDYRKRVEAEIVALLDTDCDDALLQRLELGLHHEQQHQELILTDLKYNFGFNPLYPAYCNETLRRGVDHQSEMRFSRFAGGLREIGAQGQVFAFDNEKPRHKVHVEPFQLSNRLVTNGEYMQFMRDGGYERPELWLAEGWECLHGSDWQAPLYWVDQGHGWAEYRLSGLAPVEPHLPVVHVSGHEAVAYATWAEARLPTEFEWEVATTDVPMSGNFVESRQYHPSAASVSEVGVQQLFGDVWEWTSSSYGAYPGYKPLAGTLGEYNGKFMSSQLVLRGGSCATPEAHIRPSYRNFFYPPDRWQFSGIRLARNSDE